MEVGLRPADFVLDEESLTQPLPNKKARPPNFRPMFIIVIVISLEHCTVVIGLFKFKYSAFYFRKKFNRTESVAIQILKRIFIVRTASMAADGS